MIIDWQLIAFIILAAAALVGAYRVVTSELITHAALYLALTFVATAGLYLNLKADFIAVAQVLVYGGAVMSVVVFAIMLSEQTELSGDPSEHTLLDHLKAQLVSRYWGVAPAAIAVTFILVVLSAYARVNWPQAQPVTLSNSVQEIGSLLFSTYVLPFEIASLILLVALLGAVVLVKQEEVQ